MSDLFGYERPSPPKQTTFDVIERAVAESAAHAEAVNPGWGDQALAYFRLYATLHPSFMTEAVREYAYADGLDLPPAPGAWGNVARRAKKEGYVVQRGYATSNNPSQHGKQMALFVSQIFTHGAVRVEQE